MTNPTDNLKKAVPEFIFKEIDKLGDNFKKLTFEDLRFMLKLKVANKFNLKYPDDEIIDPIVVTILRKEKGVKEKVQWEPNIDSAGSIKLNQVEQPLTNKSYKPRKSMEKKKIMGVPPVRMYKGGHIVGKLLAKRTDLPVNMLGKLVKNGLEDNACNESLSINQIRNRFNKIIEGKYVKQGVMTSEMLRKLHNDAKYNLIKNVVRPRSSVLDVGGGRGGDLSKWKSVSAKLTMIDPDEMSVIEAKRRAKKIYPSAIIKKGDIISANLRSEFDYVCYNFSLQYIFRRKWFASSSIYEIALSLKPGGKFFGIIPNADKIKKYPLDWTDQMGNTMTRENKYSDTVSFYLVDTPYYANGPIEEPLVSFKNLVKLCFEHSLKLVFVKDLLPEKTGLISDIYSMFMFEKMPDKIINRQVIGTRTILDTNLEEMVNSIAKTKRIKNIEDLILYTEMTLFDEIRDKKDMYIASEELERLRPYIRIYANRALLSVSPTTNRRRSSSPSPQRRSVSPPPNRRRSSKQSSPRLSISPLRLRGSSPSPPLRRRSISPLRLRNSSPSPPLRRRSSSPKRRGQK
jgi:SAM-dependent methyltransferase